jgi:hypothetical protein
VRRNILEGRRVEQGGPRTIEEMMMAMTEAEMGRGVAPPSGGQAFAVCGAAYLTAAALVAAVHATAPVTRGWWLVAFLSLVGGVSQLLLGPGLLALARRVGAGAPDTRAAGAELVLWNVGALAVAVADLAPSMAGVVGGSVLLVAALALCGGGLGGARSTARRPAPGWVGAYAVLLVFLAASVAVGVLLAYTRGH